MGRVFYFETNRRTTMIKDHRELTHLDAATAVTADDVMFIVDAAATNPVSKKITAAELFASRAALEVTTSQFETVAAANVITAAETGKTFFLNLAGGFASTLPAPALGLKYTFIVKVAPTTAYTVKTNGDANILHGVISTGEDAAGSVTWAAAADIISFVANKSVIGDRLEVVSDGTNWYFTGMCAVQDGMTIVQAA
jgi:hypothetical protein